MTDRELLVYVDLAGSAQLVGRLWARRVRNRDSASFEYDAQWLVNPARYALEPALVLGGGPRHTPQGRSLFGAFGDPAPDRRGRNLIQRDERRRAQAEGRAPRSLPEVDYLLGVSDIARYGALHFKEVPDGPFLATGEGTSVPPLISLGEQVNAAMRVPACDDFPQCLWARPPRVASAQHGRGSALGADQHHSASCSPPRRQFQS
jgi:serine/threonine-protein kinase HipA